MHPFLQFSLGTFVSLFPIMNPIGSAPVFVALTEDYTPKQRHRIAQRTALYTFVLLSVFLVLGGSILRFFGISLEVIRIAGGLVVFHTAWGMLNSDQTLSESEHQESKKKADIAFFPMTMPLIAGPGAIAVTLGLSAQAGHGFTVSTLLNLLATFIGIGLVVVVVYACLQSSYWLFKGLGETGVKTLTRIFGFLISAVGVQLILSGLQDWIETLSLR